MMLRQVTDRSDQGERRRAKRSDTPPACSRSRAVTWQKDDIEEPVIVAAHTGRPERCLTLVAVAARAHLHTSATRDPAWPRRVDDAAAIEFALADAVSGSERLRRAGPSRSVPGSVRSRCWSRKG